MASTKEKRGGAYIPEQSLLPQSRELGDATPKPSSTAPNSAKSWPFFVAGAYVLDPDWATCRIFIFLSVYLVGLTLNSTNRVGGMTAAVLTAPLDVLKTRLQSDFYQAQIRSARVATGQVRLSPLRSATYHLAETIQILRDVYRIEGFRALFKGLGPNLVGVIPARSINFYVYPMSKRALSEWTGLGPASPLVHLASAITAGIATGTATNPIWLVKTRLQLDKNRAAKKGDVSARQYRNSWDCVKQVFRNEGPRGFFKGLSASYLGVTESTLQWVLYEELKSRLRVREQHIVASGREKNWWDHTVSWTGNAMGAGAAKGLAAILTYPHEVSDQSYRLIIC